MLSDLSRRGQSTSMMDCVQTVNLNINVINFRKVSEGDPQDDPFDFVQKSLDWKLETILFKKEHSKNSRPL